MLSRRRNATSSQSWYDIDNQIQRLDNVWSSTLFGRRNTTSSRRWYDVNNQIQSLYNVELSIPAFIMFLSSRKIQRTVEKVPRLMQHRLPPVDNTSSQSNELASHLVYHFLWSQTKGQHGRQKKAEKPGPFWNKHWTDRDVQPLWKDLPISDKFHQPSATCTRWGRPPSCIFVREAQPWWSWILLWQSLLFMPYVNRYVGTLPRECGLPWLLPAL